MVRFDGLTDGVHAGPQGPNVGAFFDVDGTLIAGFSVIAFWRDRLVAGQFSLGDVRETLASAIGFQRGTVPFSGMMTAMAGALRGTPESELRKIGERLFDQDLATLIYPESRALVDAHRECGHTVAIVSSATPYQVAPLARDLGIDHVLSSRLEVEGDDLTGRVDYACFGPRKTEAAEWLAEREGVDLKRSYFYTDSADDLPLLRAVGRPRVVNPDRRLSRHAARRGWTQLRFHSRGTPGPIDVLRTGLAIGALGTVPWLALPGALINRDRREFINGLVSTSADVTTAIAGVRLRVLGEQHLWSHRPAVFLFNHQSAIDAILVAKMLRRDLVAVAKRELRMPVVGRLSEWAGTVYVDRRNRRQAISALRPVVDAIKTGSSLVIAPEGTRSPTPRLGPFKKGGFQVAMQARVPIVPIVFRNTLDAMPKHSLVVRPADVEAVVLPPIPTDGWTRDTLDDEIAHVHELYLKTLEQE